MCAPRVMMQMSDGMNHIIRMAVVQMISFFFTRRGLLVAYEIFYVRISILYFSYRVAIVCVCLWVRNHLRPLSACKLIEP